jgi:hypothetical protein
MAHTIKHYTGKTQMELIAEHLAAGHRLSRLSPSLQALRIANLTAAIADFRKEYGRNAVTTEFANDAEGLLYSYYVAGPEL